MSTFPLLPICRKLGRFWPLSGNNSARLVWRFRANIYPFYAQVILFSATTPRVSQKWEAKRGRGFSCFEPGKRLFLGRKANPEQDLHKSYTPRQGVVFALVCTKTAVYGLSKFSFTAHESLFCVFINRVSFIIPELGFGINICVHGLEVSSC